MNYKFTAGVETHIELSTESKIFCPCAITFGQAPNTQCCEICTGQPGTLPKLNRKVVKYAVRAGAALECDIANVSEMARKNYFYPDLPKGYQITQYDKPLCTNGRLKLSDGSVIRIRRIHIEEDAGKLIYKNGDVLIDYNRAGVPLIEIVTEPDFTSPEQIREYLDKLRLIMLYLKISDCKMQEGSMRCDVNISVQKEGETKPGTKTEIKNINSLANVVKAADAEFRRQVGILSSGGSVTAQTMRYNADSNTIEPMRSKETEAEYRYFPEPDIKPIVLSDEYIAAVKDSVPELYNSVYDRFVNEYKLSKDDAEAIARYPLIANFADRLIAECGNAKMCANIILTQMFRFFEDENKKEKFILPISRKEFFHAAKACCEGDVSPNMTRQFFDTLMQGGSTADELLKDGRFKNADAADFEQIIDKIIAENPKIADDYVSGKQKALGALMGIVMKETDGKAEPKSVRNMIINKLI